MSPEQGSPAAEAEAADAVAVDAAGAWADALERMEAELHRALAQAEPVPWRPPIALGPIPPELHENK